MKSTTSPGVFSAAVAESIGGSAGRSAHQAIQLGLRSAGDQRTTHVRGRSRRGDQPRDSCSLADRGLRATPEQLQPSCAEDSESSSQGEVKYGGSIFEILYRRYVPRMGHNQTIGMIAHKLCGLVWKILHQGIQYEERGPEIRKASKQKRTRKMI